MSLSYAHLILIDVSIQIVNEVETPYIVFNAANITKYGYNTMRSAMNGHSFGTLKGLNAVVGEK